MDEICLEYLIVVICFNHFALRQQVHFIRSVRLILLLFIIPTIPTMQPEPTFTSNNIIIYNELAPLDYRFDAFYLNQNCNDTMCASFIVEYLLRLL